jgi:hypothetical protein
MNRTSIVVSRDGAERLTLAQVMALARERGLGEQDEAAVRWQATEQHWMISWPTPAEERVG